MMNLSNLDFIKLLPQFMREDTAAQGLSNAINRLIPGLADSTMNLSTWDRIDHLSEAELDYLAWELNILWYEQNASVDIKRELVKSSDIVNQRLGTKWAVEYIIQTYFGAGTIEEWFEYNGDPGHFRVLSSNPSLSNDRLAEFLSLLEKVKRASAKLDEIIISNTGESTYSWGVALHDYGKNRWTVNLAQGG